MPPNEVSCWNPAARPAVPVAADLPPSFLVCDFFFFFCTNYVQRGVVFIFFSGKKINKQKPWAMAAGDVLCAGWFFFTPRAVG